MSKKMDSLLALSICGAVLGFGVTVCSTTSFILKQKKEVAAEVAKKEAAEKAAILAKEAQEKAEQLAEGRHKEILVLQEKADRMGEIRLGEMRMLIAARMESEAMRQRVLSQATLTPSQTENVAAMQKSIQGLDDVINNALRDVSAETAAEIKRRGAEDADRERAQMAAQAMNPKIRGMIERILQVIDATVHKANDAGLVTISSERKGDDLETCVWFVTSAWVLGERPARPTANVKYYDFMQGFKWRIMVTAAETTETFVGMPTVRIFSDDREVFIGSLADITSAEPQFKPYGPSFNSHIGGGGLRLATKQRLNDWWGTLNSKSGNGGPRDFSIEGLVPHLVTEAIKDCRVSQDIGE